MAASGGCCDAFDMFDDREFWKFSKFFEKLCNMSRPDWEDRSKAPFIASRRLAFSLLAAVGSFDLSLVAKFRKTSFGSSFGACDVYDVDVDVDVDVDAAADFAASSLCNGFGIDVCMFENFWTRSFPHLFTDSDAPAVLLLLLLWLSLSSSPLLPTLVSSDVSPAIFVASLIFFLSFPMGVFRSACSSTRLTISLTSFRSSSVKELLFRFATSRNKSETP